MNHFGATDLHGVIFVAFNCISNPVTNVNSSLIEIFHLHFGMFWLNLISKAFVLVYDHSSMLLYRNFQFIIKLAAFWYVKH